MKNMYNRGYVCVQFTVFFLLHILQVFTIEEMMPHIQHLKGAHSKNLFLKDKKKKNYWLVTVLHDRQINLNDLGKQLGVGLSTRTMSYFNFFLRIP